jgi:hypothetical protein
MPQAIWRWRFGNVTGPAPCAGSNHMLPNIRALFKAYNNVSPTPQQQKAITPKLLHSSPAARAQPSSPTQS